jgi:hypothetical protein
LNSGTHDKTNRHHRLEERKAKPRLGWDFKVVFFLVAGCLGLFEHALKGWGEAVVVAFAALIVPIYGCREFWNQFRFWIASAFLAALQVPLAFATRSWLEQGSIRTMLPLAIVDGGFVLFVIFLVCQKPQP